MGLQPGQGSIITGGSLWGHCQGQLQSHPVGSFWSLIYFLLKTQLGNERSLAMGMGVGQMGFLSPLPDQQDFWIFILSLTDEENKLCVSCLQSLGESGYGWLWELRGLLGQSTHWTDGERSQRSSGHCAESSVSWGALK